MGLKLRLVEFAAEAVLPVSPPKKGMENRRSRGRESNRTAPLIPPRNVRKSLRLIVIFYLTTNFLKLFWK